MASPLASLLSGYSSPNRAALAPIDTQELMRRKRQEEARLTQSPFYAPPVANPLDVPFMDMVSEGGAQHFEDLGASPERAGQLGDVFAAVAGLHPAVALLSTGMDAATSDKPVDTYSVTQTAMDLVNSPLKTLRKLGEALPSSEVTPMADDLATAMSEQAVLPLETPPPQFDPETVVDFTRTKVDPETGYLYHATNVPNAQDIAEAGYVGTYPPDYGTDQSTWPDAGVENRSYWTQGDPSPFVPEGGKPVLLRTKQTPSFKAERGTSDWYATDPIHAPEYLSTSGWRTLGAPVTTLAADVLAPAAAAPTPQAKIKAYHGSPHDFDEFDISKIGTGEGAQAYGHGLYFAENEGVAKSYRDNISASQDPLANMNMAIERLIDPQTGYMKKRLTPEFLAEQLAENPNYRSISFIKDDPDALRDFHAIVQGHNADGTVTDEAIRAMRRIENNPNIPQKSKGSMYEVDINADPEAFLDWDKPADEGSGIGGLLKTRAESVLADPNADLKMKREAKEALGMLPRGNMTVSEAYDSLSWITPGGKAEATEVLKQSGIPGIKYLDQGSRYTPANLPNNSIANEARQFLDAHDGDAAAALKAFHGSNPVERWATTERAEIEKVINAAGRKATRNYVVFDPKIIEIVRKYGIVGALGAGLISQEMAEQMQAQGMEEGET